MPRRPSRTSIDSQLRRHVQRARQGSVFTTTSFNSLGSPAAVDKALQRLVRAGTLRRLSPGLYDKPRHHEVLGDLWPSVENVVRALEKKNRLTVIPAGAYAANLLGLSEQVPLKVVYLTDGPNRRILLGRQEIHFRRTTPKNLDVGPVSALVIQSLRHLGQSRVDGTTIAQLRRRLRPVDRVQLQKDAAQAPAWIGRIMRDVSTSEETLEGT